MSRKPLPAEEFEPSASETAEVTEIDGMEQGAILRFTDVGSAGKPSEAKELHTCYGDLYVIVNALRDYANLLEGAVEAWSVPGCHAAPYEFHAARCRKIAGKYAAAIDYDYDKALERCQKRRTKEERNSDTGMDGLEALIRNREHGPSKKEQGDSDDSQWKESEHGQD